MKNTKQNIINTIVAAFVIMTGGFNAHAQLNPKIKVYFNHPVNNAVSTGTNAIYTAGFADTIAAYINRAKYTVDIAQYDFAASSSSSAIAVISTAANAAAARGVVVRWIYCTTEPNTGLSLLSSSIHTVGSPTTGVNSSYISHNKFMIIDRNVASSAILCTSSMDWSDEMITEDYNNMVFIQDQTLAKAYTSQFVQMWGDTTATPGTGKWSTSKTASTTTSFTVNGTPIQVYFSPMDGAEAQLENVINSANSDMYFGIYDFTLNTPAEDMSTKYRHGVTGFGNMDQYSTTGTTVGPYDTLKATNVLGTTNLQIYTGSYIYHNKIICVDANNSSSDPQVGCGSYNWTSAASNYNDENFMVIHDATIANLYYQSLCQDFHVLGGAACTASTTGISKYDFGSQQLAVYPNPVVDVVNVTVKNAGATLSVRVTDQLGKVVLENQVSQTNETQLNLSGLSSGVYFVIVTTGNATYTQKLIK